MKCTLLVSAAASAALSLLAWESGLATDRPLTEDERTKLVAAMTAEGCSGGQMEFDDDGHYEVDDARCSDGRRYDLKFDASFKLIGKALDD
jgi:hypothetical protein